MSGLLCSDSIARHQMITVKKCQEKACSATIADLKACIRLIASMLRVWLMPSRAVKRKKSSHR